MPFVVEKEIRTTLTADARTYTETLKQAENRARDFGQRTKKTFDDTGKSTSALSGLQKLGAERMSKYATVASSLTGSMSALGVKTEVVSRSMAVAMDMATGMAGALGIALTSVGALAAGIGYLVMQHEKWDAAMKANTAELISMYQKTGVTSALGKMVLEAERARLEEAKRTAEATLADLQKTLEVGIVRLDPLTKKLLGYDEMERLRGKAAAALVELQKVTAQLEALKKAQGAGPGTEGQPFQFPTVNVSAGRVRPVAPSRFMEEEGETRDLRAQQMGPSSIYAAGLRPADIWSNITQVDKLVGVRDAITGDINVPLMETLSLSDQLQQSLMKIPQNFAAISAASSAAYSTMQKHAATMSKFQEVTARRVAKMLVQSYREGAAAYIETKGQESAIDGMIEAAKAIAAFASGRPAAGAMHLVASGKFLAIAGAAAIGASIIRGGAEEAGGGAGGGGGTEEGSISGTGPSNRLVNAEAGPTTVNYIVTWQQYGTVIYGAAGLRDWYQRELRELIRADFGKGNL